jgi:hypothetical protein
LFHIFVHSSIVPFSSLLAPEGESGQEKGRRAQVKGDERMMSSTLLFLNNPLVTERECNVQVLSPLFA